MSGIISEAPHHDPQAIAQSQPEAGGFSDVLRHVMNGRKAYRDGWNGKNQFIFVAKASVPHPLHVPGENEPKLYVNMELFLAIYTVHSEVVPWVPSQSDMFAHDWYLI